VATPPINATLVIHQGTTWERRWRITDPDTGEPRDLTEWSARGHIRLFQSDVDPTYEWMGSGISCDADGYVTVRVTPAESTAWTWRDGVYDLELVDPTGRVARIAQGAVRVSPEVTR
jgi:hypothetical protein